MERANGARNGKTQSEPRAKRVHEPMAPGAVRRTAWVADAGAPVPSVFLGGVPGLWGGAGRAEALPLSGVSRVFGFHWSRLVSKAVMMVSAAWRTCSAVCLMSSALPPLQPFT